MIAVNNDDGGVTVRVVGELDLATAPELNAVLHEAGGAHDRVVLDLAGVTFVDSSGLAVLLVHRRAIRARGARLHLIHPQANVSSAFELAGLTDPLAIV